MILTDPLVLLALFVVGYIAAGVVVWVGTPEPSDSEGAAFWKQICLWPLTVTVVILVLLTVLYPLKYELSLGDDEEKVQAAKERSADVDDWSEVRD